MVKNSKNVLDFRTVEFIQQENELLKRDVTNLKARCRELSQENLFLKSEIADMGIANILGGA